MINFKVLLIVFCFCVSVRSVLVEPPVVESPQCEYPEGLHFNLSNSGIRHLPKSFLPSSLMTCISLDNNVINEIDEGAFGDFPNLRYLNLGDNSLDVCDPFLMDRYPKLETFILDHAVTRDKCESGHKLEFKAELPCLKTLYLRRNEIKSISWMNMPQLRQLYLSNNSLYTLETSNGQFKNITHLHLNDNRFGRIDCLPLQSLEELMINDNGIYGITNTPHYFPDGLLRFGQNTNLKKLAMRGNKITRLNEGALRNLKNLQYLDLSFNDLHYIHEDVFVPLLNLNTLLLDNNQLELVPNFSGLKNMELLLLNNNIITKVDDNVFRGMSELVKLRLSDNRITEISAGTFNELPSLQELDLSNNELITCAENWISSLTSLRQLLLNHNKFDNVANISLNATDKLQYVNLANNPFTNMSVASLMLLPDNAVIDLKWRMVNDY